MTFQKAPITTHILNLQDGAPAEGVSVSLITAGGQVIGPVATDVDGRISTWPEPIELSDGLFHLKFQLEPWFAARGEPCFFPEVLLTFMVDRLRPHYHVPLLLNRYGYSTYRGS